jgi:hypothetical protein
MADTPRCDDIASGVIIGDISTIEHDLGLGGIVSDRRLKRDITPVDWSR